MTASKNFKMKYNMDYFIIVANFLINFIQMCSLIAESIQPENVCKFGPKTIVRSALKRKMREGGGLGSTKEPPVQKIGNRKHEEKKR